MVLMKVALWLDYQNQLVFKSRKKDIGVQAEVENLLTETISSTTRPVMVSYKNVKQNFKTFKRVTFIEVILSILILTKRKFFSRF